MPSNAETVARHAATAAGLTLTDFGLSHLTEYLTTFGRMVPGEPVTVTVENETIAFDEWFSAQQAASPDWFRASGPAKIPVMPASANMTQRAIHANTIANSAKLADGRALAESVVARFGNPFRTGNMTHRAIVTNGDPDLAARLQKEAGK